MHYFSHLFLYDIDYYFIKEFNYNYTLLKYNKCMNKIKII